jgi:hypothetical protein
LKHRSPNSRNKTRFADIPEQELRPFDELSPMTQRPQASGISEGGDSTSRTASWTAAEEFALASGIQIYGNKGPWSKIKNDPRFSQLLSKRTSDDLKDKAQFMNEQRLNTILTGDITELQVGKFRALRLRFFDFPVRERSDGATDVSIVIGQYERQSLESPARENSILSLGLIFYP